MALTKVTGQVIKNTTDVTVGVLTVTNTLAVGGTVSIGGTLTYEDVTNVDAVGLITARNGIVVGSGITLSKDGDAFFTGVTTATKFVGANAEVSGDLSGATGTFTGNVSIADKIIHTGDTDTAIRFPADDIITMERSGTEVFRLDSSGLKIPDKLIHTGDTDTFLEFGTDTINFDTGGSERVRIDSSGRLGLGTNNPDTLLHLKATGGSTLQRFESSSYSSYIAQIQANDNVSNGSLAGELALRGQSGVSVSANNGTATHFRITSAGLVGIGSDAPTHNLDIHASGNPYLKLLRSGYNPVYIGNAAGEGVIETTGATFFKTGGSERFRVNSDGNVSIGNNPTVSSDTLFHVEKSGETNVQFEGDTSTLGARLTLKNNNTGAGAKNQIDFADAGGQSTSSIQAYNTDQTNNYGYLTFNTRSAQGTPPEERMRISKEGYVTTPQQPYVMLGLTANQAVTQSVTKEVIFDSVMYDTAGGYNSSNGRYTCPVVGDYLITFDCQYTGTVNAFHLGVGVNGTNPPGGTNFDLWNHTGDNVRGDNIARVIRITATTQYISFFTYTNSSGANLEPNRTKATIKFLG